MLYVQHVGISFLIFISSFVSGVIGGFHHQTKIVVSPLYAPTTTTEQSSEVVPALPSSTSTADAYIREGTSSPLALFRTNKITFFYTPRRRAIWFDLYNEMPAFYPNTDSPTVEYLYRYPYDLEKDSDVDAVGNYRFFNGNNYGFMLDERSLNGAETIETYIEHYHLLDLSTAEPYHNDYFSGYIFIDYGDGPGETVDVAVFHNKTDPENTVFVMLNTDKFFSKDEFTEIVKTARLTKHPSH